MDHERGYPVIRDFTSRPGLVLLVITPSRPGIFRLTSTLGNPWNRTNICTSQEGLILTPNKAVLTVSEDEYDTPSNKHY